MKFIAFIVLSLTILILLCIILIDNADESQALGSASSMDPQNFGSGDRSTYANSSIMSSVASFNASPDHYEIETPNGTISCIVSSTNGSVPFTVHFTDTSTVNKFSSFWSFGDPNTGDPAEDINEKNITYTYRYPGTYHAIFNVTYYDEGDQLTSNQLNIMINVDSNFHSYSTKTTGGWPFLKNDEYNTLGVEVTGTYHDEFGEWVDLEIVDLSSSRKNGSTDKTYTIKSQSIKLDGFKAQQIFWTNMSIDPEWAWPYDGPDSKTMRVHPDTPLLTSTINATRENMAFPLNSTVLNESMAGGSDDFNLKNYAAWKVKPVDDHWNWTYTTCPWGNMSDCAASTQCVLLIDSGSTVDFDIIGYTQWGLFDNSQSKVHVKIIAPAGEKDLNATIQMS